MKRSELKILTILFFCSIYLLYAFASKSIAVGKATSMGDLQTVVPTGPFDVARNPALLPLQEKANSTGLFYTYISHYPGCASRNQDQYVTDNNPPVYDAPVNSTSKQDDPDIKGMSGHIANSTKTASTAFGFAITDNGNDQYSVTKRRSTVESMGYDFTNSCFLFYKSDEDIKTTEINPALIASIGTNISNTSFIGFQIIAGYSNRTEEKKKFEWNYKGALPPPQPGAQFEEESEKEVNRISAELGFGYLYRDNNNQVGLMIRTGEVAWAEKSLTITRIDSVPAYDFVHTSSTIKTNARYISGPSIIAGAYKKINPFFAFAFETGIKLETSTNEKDLVYKHNIRTIEEEESVNRSKNTYLFKAGIELNLIKNLAFTTGLGYVEGAFETNRYERNGTNENSVTGNYETKRAFITLGLQYIISSNMTIDLLAACTGYRDTVHIKIGNRDTASTNKFEVKVNQKEEGVFGYTGLGVTLSL